METALQCRPDNVDVDDHLDDLLSNYYELNLMSNCEVVFDVDHGIVEFRGELQGKVRSTKNGELLSVFDIIKLFTDVKNPRDAWKEIKNIYPDVVDKSDNLKFPGRGQKLTPVMQVKAIKRLLMVLPGQKAAKMRDLYADLIGSAIRRHISGPIKISEPYQRRFQLEYDNRAIVIFNDMKRRHNLKDVSLDVVKGKTGVYIAGVGVENEVPILKYGETRINYGDCIDRHIRRYTSITHPSFYPAIIPFYFREVKDSYKVETMIGDTLKNHGLHLGTNYKIADDTKGNRELFTVNDEFTLPQVIGLVDNIIDKYEVECIAVVDDTQNARDHEYRMAQIDLEKTMIENEILISKEKTRQMEIELEIMRLRSKISI